MKKRNLIELTIVALLGLIVCIETGLLINDYLYFFSIGEDYPPAHNAIKPKTTATPKTIWKTYTNSRMGYSVEYPSGWITKEFTRDYARIGESTGVAFRPPAVIQNVNWGLVTVEVENSKTGLTVDNFINNHLCDSPGICAKAEEAIPITISNYPGKKVINPPSPVESQIAVVIKDNKVYHLTVLLDKSFENLYSREDKEKIFNKMISTFQFTDQTPTTGTASWKTYISQKYSYSLEYPPTAHLLNEIPFDFEIFIQRDNPVGLYEGNYIRVELLKNPNNLSLYNLGNYRYSNIKENPADRKWKEEKFAGETALYAEFEGEGDIGIQRVYLIEKNKNFYAISKIYRDNDNTDYYKNLSEQILSTFKFTE